MLRIFVLVVLLVSMLCAVSSASDLRALQDKFYAGITDIVQRNMEDPQQCLGAVDRYFEDNQALVAQIRMETEKAMAQSAPMMQKMIDKYQSMSEEELQALEKKSAATDQRMQSQMSSTMTRYNEVMSAFMERYPKYAMELAGKMMRLMPGFDKQMPMQKGW